MTLTFDNIQLSIPTYVDSFPDGNLKSAVNYTGNINQKQTIPQYAAIEKYIQAAISDNTRKAYQNDLSHFVAWGGTIPATTEMVSQYLVANVGILSPATLSRRIVAISRAHTAQGLKSPCKSDLVKATLRGIRRTIGTAQRQAAPATKDYVVAMVNKLESFKGMRDRAMLLVGFAGALRRSELVAIQCKDIEFSELGLIVNITCSKTDQEKQGRKVAIPYARGIACPVLSLKAWLSASGITDGPIFRPVTRHAAISPMALSSQAVAVVVKERAAAIGLDPAKYSGHSLRAGLVTSAAQAGVSSWKIRQQTGHKSDAMLFRYIRDANIFVDNAAGAVL